MWWSPSKEEGTTRAEHRGIPFTVNEVKGTGMVRQWGADENVKEAGGGFPSATVSSASQGSCSSPLCLSVTESIFFFLQCISSVFLFLLLFFSFSPGVNALTKISDVTTCWNQKCRLVSILQLTSSFTANKVDAIFEVFTRKKTRGIIQYLLKGESSLPQFSARKQASFFFLLQRRFLQGCLFFVGKFQTFLLSASFSGSLTGNSSPVSPSVMCSVGVLPEPW